jgi:hypothetical protein
VISSKTQIRVASRSFETVDELIESTVNEGLALEYVGPISHWFKNETVMFPDKDYSSSAFVEVCNNHVLVGRPNDFLDFEFSAWLDALIWADTTNKEWLEFTGSPAEFLALLLAK